VYEHASRNADGCVAVVKCSWQYHMAIHSAAREYNQNIVVVEQNTRVKHTNDNTPSQRVSVGQDCAVAFAPER